MSEELVSHLGRVPLFAGLDAEALSSLARACRRRRFAAGAALFHERDPGHTLYVILSGAVDIQKVSEGGRTVHLAELGPGEHFGELSLLDGAPRSADAVARGECDLLMLDRDAFIGCVRRSPDTALAILGSLAARLRGTSERTAADRTLDVMGRLAAFLLERGEACEGDAPPGGAQAQAPPRLTQQEIADRIGATRESVNRALTRLKKAGAVRTCDDGRIAVANPRKLARYVSG